MSTYQLVRSRNGEDERPRVETVPNPRQLDPSSFVSDTHLPLLLGTDTLVAVVMQAAAYGFTPLRAHLRHIAWRPLTGPEHEIEDARQKRYDVGLCPKHWREVFPRGWG